MTDHEAMSFLQKLINYYIVYAMQCKCMHGDDNTVCLISILAVEDIT